MLVRIHYVFSTYSVRIHNDRRWERRGWAIAKFECFGVFMGVKCFEFCVIVWKVF